MALTVPCAVHQLGVDPMRRKVEHACGGTHDRVGFGAIDVDCLPGVIGAHDEAREGEEGHGNHTVATVLHQDLPWDS